MFVLVVRSCQFCIRSKGAETAGANWTNRISVDIIIVVALGSEGMVVFWLLHARAVHWKKFLLYLIAPGMALIMIMPALIYMVHSNYLVFNCYGPVGKYNDQQAFSFRLIGHTRIKFG